MKCNECTECCTLRAMTISRTLPDPQTTPTITVPQAAALLGVSERQAYYAVRAGEIPCIRVGSRVVIPTAKFLTKFELIPTATAA